MFWNSLLPYTSEIIWGVVLGDIYWIVPCAYPIPKFFVVEFSSIVFLNPSIRRVAIDNITFFVLIVTVVKRGEVNLFVYVVNVQKSVHSFKALYHIEWKTNNPVVKSWLGQLQSALIRHFNSFN